MKMRVAKERIVAALNDAKGQDQRASDVNVARAIETSIRENRTVELYRDSTTRAALEAECEDYEENDEFGQVTFWGADEDGDAWKVRISTR
jgi:hypothetical protein